MVYPSRVQEVDSAMIVTIDMDSEVALVTDLAKNICVVFELPMSTESSVRLPAKATCALLGEVAVGMN